MKCLNLKFPELEKAIQQLNYPNNYYNYCIMNGVDTFECLSIIVENKKYTNVLNGIPSDHWIGLKTKISSLTQYGSNIETKTNDKLLLFSSHSKWDPNEENKPMH